VLQVEDSSKLTGGRYFIGDSSGAERLLLVSVNSPTQVTAAGLPIVLQKAYARTWASQTPHVNASLAAGATVIAAPDSTTSPLKIHGPGSNLADRAEVMAVSNPSGWSGVIKVKTPAGATLGYILLYSNP